MNVACRRYLLDVEWHFGLDDLHLALRDRPACRSEAHFLDQFKNGMFGHLSFLSKEFFGEQSDVRPSGRGGFDPARSAATDRMRFLQSKAEHMLR